MKSHCRLRGEDYLSKQVCAWLAKVSFEGKFKGVWFHVPNELPLRGKNNLSFELKLEAIGKVPGAPDFVIISPQKTILFELKYGRNSLNENQQLFKKWCELDSISYYLIRELDELKNIMGSFGLLDNE